MGLIGARDLIDVALVRQYSKVQTTNFDEPKINPDEMWQKLHLISLSQKTHIEFKRKQDLKKIS